MSKLIERYIKARQVGVPIVAITTADPAATIRQLAAVGPQDRKVVWDVARGCYDPPSPSQKYGLHKEIAGDPDETKLSPFSFLEAIHKMPAGCVAIMCMADRHWAGEMATAVIQGIWNTRDAFKSTHRMLVLLVRNASLPAELKDDVVVLDEPLPGQEQLRVIVDSTAKAAAKASDKFSIDEETAVGCVSRVTGLSSFAAEQAIAMSTSATGIDLDTLWEQKRKLVSATAGLSVYSGGERFDDLGGVENVKTFMRRVLTGKRKPNGVVFVDEIEKAIAGAAGDTSGTSQGILQSLLTEMQDRSAAGCILIGPPGAAKSAIAKATGNEGGLLTMQFDLNGLKGSLVGETEAKCREALKVIDSVTDGAALWLATCNSIAAVPVELRRRFTLGTFFFDLPDDTERKAIWKIYLAKCGLKVKPSDFPADRGWTGAEIKTCCELSRDLGMTLKEAAAYIVPVCKSAAQQIEQLRRQASGRFISASHTGVYEYDSTLLPTTDNGERQFSA